MSAGPPRRTHVGIHVVLRPLDPARDAEALWHAAHDGADPALWHFLPYGPFADVASYRA